MKAFIRKKEGGVEKETCKLALDKHGIPNCKMSPVGQIGYPDRAFWIPGGKPLLIEFKRPGEIPTPAQEHNHKMLRTLGYVVEVHNDTATAIRSICKAKARALEAMGLPEEGY